MKGSRTLVVGFLSLILVAPGLAQESASPSEQAERFLTEVGGGGVEGALDTICAGSLLAANVQQLVLLKGQIEMALPLYGGVLGFEKVEEEVFGDSLVRLTYLQKFERHPLVWEFFFYRPKDGWVLSNIQFADQFALLSGSGS